MVHVQEVSDSAAGSQSALTTTQLFTELRQATTVYQRHPDIRMLVGSVQMLHDAHPRLVTLPVEVICRILGFLSPREIICLRTISKQFRDITYDSAIWKTVYANACLPHPPGPFPSQSTKFLEHTLLQSERLAQTWTSHPVKVISRVLGPKLSMSQPEWSVLDGKWLVWREETQILCHDFDTGSHQILWEGNLDLVYSGAGACSVTSVDGRRVYIALRCTQPDQGGLPITQMLEFAVDESCSLSAPVSVDVPFLPRDVPRSLVISARWPFVCIYELAWESRIMVWDMRTRIFYAFPLFNSALDVVKVPKTKRPELILSTTHVITLYRLHDLDTGTTTTFFQAFVVPDLPPSPGNGIRELRLTHEASMARSMSPSATRIMRNSVFDPVTRATSLRLLTHFTSGDYTQYTCIDLTLPQPDLSPGNPLSMSIDTQDLFTTDTMYNRFTTSSDDGHLRGFTGGFDVSRVWKFSVDASKERCVAVLGEGCPMTSIDSFNFTWRKCEFDGIRGRLCYMKRDREKNCENIVAVDLE
ncbi:hypothetical protein PAXINDRAFT_96861 [Paxillus involutus ATCC 200175]|nr:hypothetical protein PAXINDRAFT_96861 [Paxillus involutus ATCC 200175]